MRMKIHLLLLQSKRKVLFMAERPYLTRTIEWAVSCIATLRLAFDWLIQGQSKAVWNSNTITSESLQRFLKFPKIFEAKVKTENLYAFI